MDYVVRLTAFIHHFYCSITSRSRVISIPRYMNGEINKLCRTLSSTDEFDSVSNTGNFTPVEWTPELGWLNGSRTTTYPRPAAGSGSHMGLTVILDGGLEEYYCSSGNSAGFKVQYRRCFLVGLHNDLWLRILQILLHNPTETPKISDYGFSIALGQETRVVITPRLSDASPLIRSVHSQQRQCIFANEANLTYFRCSILIQQYSSTELRLNDYIITFRTYSRKNCEMECESRIIEENCGCVQFYMPRLNENTKICNQKDYECYNRINTATDMSDDIACKCSPGCFEINYKASVYISELGNGSFLMRDKELTQSELHR